MSGCGSTRVSLDVWGCQPEWLVDQFFCVYARPVDAVTDPTNVHAQVAAIGPTQLRKPLREPGEPTLCSSQSIVFIAHHQHAQASHAVGLLRARRERPRCRATADE
jgi:hypothetical protein